VNQPGDIFGSGMLPSYQDREREEEKDLVENGDEILKCAQPLFLAMAQAVPRPSRAGSWVPASCLRTALSVQKLRAGQRAPRPPLHIFCSSLMFPDH